MLSSDSSPAAPAPDAAPAVEAPAVEAAAAPAADADPAADIEDQFRAMSARLLAEFPVSELEAKALDIARRLNLGPGAVPATMALLRSMAGGTVTH